MRLRIEWGTHVRGSDASRKADSSQLTPGLKYVWGPCAENDAVSGERGIREFVANPTLDGFELLCGWTRMRCDSEGLLRRGCAVEGFGEPDEE